MNVSTILIRVQSQIEDVNADLYSTTEVLSAINTAKDEVLSEVITNSDTLLQSSEVISFGVGDKEKTLTASPLGILRIESTPTGSSETYSHPVSDFREQDNFPNGDIQGLYLRVNTTSQYILGRRNTDESLVVTVFYIADVSDVLSTGSIVFAPVPACNLITTKATNILLASRNRHNPIFLRQEEVQKALLSEVLQKLNRTSPRYVHFVRS